MFPVPVGASQQPGLGPVGLHAHGPGAMPGFAAEELVPGAAGMHQFWELAHDLYWCSGHPALMVDPDITVPMEIFGDDAGLWKTETSW